MLQIKNIVSEMLLFFLNFKIKIENIYVKNKISKNVIVKKHAEMLMFGGKMDSFICFFNIFNCLIKTKYVKRLTMFAIKHKKCFFILYRYAINMLKTIFIINII